MVRHHYGLLKTWDQILMIKNDVKFVLTAGANRPLTWRCISPKLFEVAASEAGEGSPTAAAPRAQPRCRGSFPWSFAFVWAQKGEGEERKTRQALSVCKPIINDHFIKCYKVFNFSSNFFGKNFICCKSSSKICKSCFLLELVLTISVVSMCICGEQCQQTETCICKWLVRNVMLICFHTFN